MKTNYERDLKSFDAQELKDAAEKKKKEDAADAKSAGKSPEAWIADMPAKYHDYLP